MTKLTIKNALTNVGVMDKEKQNAFLMAFEGRNISDISEEDVIIELKKVGITDEQKQMNFIAAVKEPEILDQELDIEELEAVAGGDCSLRNQEADLNCCVKDHYRTYLKDGCAGTVTTWTEIGRSGKTIIYTKSESVKISV